MPDPMPVTQEQVTQADRDAAKEFIFLWNRDLATDDDLSVAFARHRLTHTEPQDASRPSEVVAKGPFRDATMVGLKHKIYEANGWRRKAGESQSSRLKPLYDFRVDHKNGQIVAALRTQEARPEAVEAVVASGLIAEPWELEDPDILDRLREEGMFEAVEEIEGLQERCRLAALSEQPRTDAAGIMRAALEKIGFESKDAWAAGVASQALARIDQALGEQR